MSTRIIDETGNTYSLLTVTSLAGSKTNKRGKKIGAKWRCSCSCGGSIEVLGDLLRRGKVTNCGCVKKERLVTSPEEAGFRLLLHDYKRNSISRGHIWSLTDDEFKKLTSSNCHYCGIPPEAKRKPSKKQGHYSYNGVDRVDNDEGYTTDNSVPCCRQCNFAKRTLPYNEFMEWVARIYNHSFTTVD